MKYQSYQKPAILDAFELKISKCHILSYHFSARIGLEAENFYEQYFMN